MHDQLVHFLLEQKSGILERVLILVGEAYLLHPTLVELRAAIQAQEVLQSLQPFKVTSWN